MSWWTHISSFERVHRMRTKKVSSRPQPVIAKFSFYQDKEYIWSFVRNLKGSGIGISNDFPKEIDEIHEKLYLILKKAKQDRQSAYFKVDKLIINGQVYRGKETEDLLHYGAIMWTDRMECCNAKHIWTTYMYVCIYMWLFNVYNSFMLFPPNS